MVSCSTWGKTNKFYFKLIMLELIEHFHVNLMQASQDDTSYQLSTMHKWIAFLTSYQYSISQNRCSVSVVSLIIY